MSTGHPRARAERMVGSRKWVVGCVGTLRKTPTGLRASVCLLPALIVSSPAYVDQFDHRSTLLFSGARKQSQERAPHTFFDLRVVGFSTKSQASLLRLLTSCVAAIETSVLVWVF